jgi:hypothetical protein
MAEFNTGIKPHLSTPFPKNISVWKDPITGLETPKHEIANLKFRQNILKRAQFDTGFQKDLLQACNASLLYWINTFVWTFHQFDVKDGKRIPAINVDVPFITWEIQDDLLNLLCSQLYGGEREDRDVLVDKSRDMGASWCCFSFLHWIWLFKSNAQLLELSRTEDYVDRAGNMKALFQRHDYINYRLPSWMRPPNCLVGEKNRTKMHIHNEWKKSNLDGESTTEHAASGDRRLVILLDEFSKVKNGALMRSATRDAGLMRIVNSTISGPGSEYSKWKNSGQIKVFPLMWWDHPDKGKGRYVEQDPITKVWKIRSPWYNNEELVRTKKEMAREIDAIDVEAGDTFFSSSNIDKHIVLFGRDPLHCFEIDIKPHISNDAIKEIIERKNLDAIFLKSTNKERGPLRIWANLIDGRLNQNHTYIIGGDIGKGQGASNSVLSIKCKETNEKVGEWRNANHPPYELSRIAIALALWVGGRDKLPFLKWEMNGPGWDFGRQIVVKYLYPFYYRDTKIGKNSEKKSKSYGWHSGRDSKEVLLREYDRALAFGNYINHSIFSLQEARNYIYFGDGSIGPAMLVEENASARLTHGDCVIADALTVDHKNIIIRQLGNNKYSTRTPYYRKQQYLKRHKKNKHDYQFNFWSRQCQNL